MCNGVRQDTCRGRRGDMGDSGKGVRQGGELGNGGLWQEVKDRGREGRRASAYEYGN